MRSLRADTLILAVSPPLWKTAGTHPASPSHAAAPSRARSDKFLERMAGLPAMAAAAEALRQLGRGGEARGALEAGGVLPDLLGERAHDRLVREALPLLRTLQLPQGPRAPMAPHPRAPAPHGRVPGSAALARGGWVGAEDRSCGRPGEGVGRV